MYASFKGIVTKGYRHDRYGGTITGCGWCTIRKQCIRKLEVSQVRQVSFFGPDQASQELLPN
jgi:hypothetical protein